MAGFHDIIDGSNGAYKAGPGWDACTGLGSPNGTALLARLSSRHQPHAAADHADRSHRYRRRPRFVWFRHLGEQRRSRRLVAAHR